jgi:phosphogluconate dehydratase
LSRTIDERALVNAIVALLATGGSTNHTIHLVAIAHMAGISLTWDDFAELSEVVPLLARIYPNGAADVNHFHAAGGTGFLIRELLAAGLMHADIPTIMGSTGLAAHAQEPWLSPDGLAWRPSPAISEDLEVLRPVEHPFGADGGLKLLKGNLGRAVIKTSAVAPAHRVVEAPALVFDDQAAVATAFETGRLHRDCVVVVRYQGPRANGMPELHQLTPLLTSLQSKGHRVALVTDGRMSGASGAIPAAIHLTPEASRGGPLGRLRDGDVIELDSYRGALNVQLDSAGLQARTVHAPGLQQNEAGMGRELFGAFRYHAGDAEAGAIACIVNVD